MFKAIMDEKVGIKGFHYLPQGCSPYAHDNLHPAPNVIITTGDPVEVLSAWTRPYLPDTAPTLYYVRSLNTGECTHVVAADLIR